MANNRYYLYCRCGKVRFIGKSLGNGIYNTGSDWHTFLDEVYEWMWDHLMSCNEPPDEYLSQEWIEGEIFKVLTEGDGRVMAAVAEIE